MNRSWLGLCVTILLGCSSSSGDQSKACGTFAVGVQVTGTEAAFSGRQVEIQGRVLPAAEETSPGEWSTFESFCTNSEDAFLNQLLQVRVLSGDAVVSEAAVDRVCRYVEMEGKNSEENHIVIEQDGTVSQDIMNSICMATCSVPKSCDDDLFASK